MSDTVIQVEGLGKRYRLGVVGTGTLAHDLNRWWARVRGKPDPTLTVDEERRRLARQARAPAVTACRDDDDARELLEGPQQQAETQASHDHIWALQDVSFEVARGEIVGIIGANGAGKSTLLKILTRITAPTAGVVRLKGRVASLLEVGTGFHPELTGRENVYLNGAILGMTKREIETKFEEIVEFAEIREFIDTPVKRYSSGMYVRLAFAVAAHLESEILLIDEVLAVGDAGFQRKCLGKMGDVARGGRTVLFVSHNMAAVRMLTLTSIHLASGKVADHGATNRVVDYYVQAMSSSRSHEGTFDLTSPSLRPKSCAGGTVFTRVCFRDPADAARAVIFQDEPICLDVHFVSTIRTDRLEILLRVSTLDDVLLFTSTTGQALAVTPGAYRVRCSIEGGRLLPGTYQVLLYALTSQAQDVIPGAATFEIVAKPDATADGREMRTHTGVMRVEATWGRPQPESCDGPRVTGRAEPPFPDRLR